MWNRVKILRVWINGNIKTTKMIHGCHIKLLANLLKVEIPWDWAGESTNVPNRIQRRLELCQTSNMERFANILNGWKPLTNFTKRAILYIWHGSAYTSAYFQHRRRSHSSFVSQVLMPYFKENWDKH